MAFFSKPTTKKPDRPKGGVRTLASVQPRIGNAVSARELALQAARKTERRPLEPANGDITISGPSLVQWATGASFEVAEASAGLCAVLENAALRYASGQATEARASLEEGIEKDADAKASPLAWLALFDLLQRAGDQAAFDRLALQYVVQFERSAPAWESRASPKAAPRLAGGTVIVTGKLTATSTGQLEGIRRAIARRADDVRVDLMSVSACDDAGARLLAGALADARRARVALKVQTGPRLLAVLDLALKKGREAGEGAWLLSLELLQWANERTAFEDRAVDFAVAFEVSPPSWEPPAIAAGDASAPAEKTDSAGDRGDDETLQWSGTMAGSFAPQLGRLVPFAQAKTVVPIDMTEVDRIDFVCAGALLNAITRVEAQRKSVQIVGASPIVRALLLLIGVSPRHFVKKAA